MGDGHKPPSEQYPQLYNFTKATVNKRLDDKGAWPENPLKLELEGAGIYQDFSGPAIGELETKGEIKRFTVDGHRYLTKATGSKDALSESTRIATNDFATGLQQQGRAFFAECIVYTCLCKIYTEVRDNIDLDILPKGNYTRKMRGYRGELDGLLELQHELFPIEVYNGYAYMNKKHDKMSEAKKMNSSDEPVSNPLIVGRLSSKGARRQLFKMNGAIIDAGKIFCIEGENKDFVEASKELNVRNHIETVPPIQASNTTLDGKSYHSKALDAQGHYEKIQPENIKEGIDGIPDPVVRRFRGGVHLLYVNTFYRRSDERLVREASLVIQEAYNRLLRRESGIDSSELLDQAWSDFDRRYRRLKDASARKEAIIDNAREITNRLEKEGVILRRNGKLYARASDHPHITLETSFS